MKVGDIMVRDVVWVAPDTKITKVAEILFERGFHGLPVVENGRIVGMITENDFFIKNSASVFLPTYIKFLRQTGFADKLPQSEKEKLEKLLNATASDIMSRDCVTAFPEMELDELWDLTMRTKFNTLPVADKDKNLLGIVTRIDVVGLLKDSGQLSRLGSAQADSKKEREVDFVAEQVLSWWERSFLFIKKNRIKTWKWIFAIAFISGMIATFLWTASVKIQDNPEKTKLEKNR